MRFGFVLPGGPVRRQVELAEAAEAAGWDGIFVAELSYGVDAWTLLAAMAEHTTTIRLGTMLTPLPWRRPWKLASQVATLDELSGGRAVLTVGLGAADPALGTFGEATERRTRAERLDEGIDVLTAIWAGEGFAGRHYDVDLSERLAGVGTLTPVQQPRVPIWVVGAWPHPKSMARVARADGLVPAIVEAGAHRPPTPDDIRAMIEWLDANGGRRAGFDVINEGETPADDRAAAAAIVAPFVEAGCTWWLESRWMVPDGADQLDVVGERIAAGPPNPG